VPNIPLLANDESLGLSDSVNTSIPGSPVVYNPTVHVPPRLREDAEDSPPGSSTASVPPSGSSTRGTSTGTAPFPSAAFIASGQAFVSTRHEDDQDNLSPTTGAPVSAIAPHSPNETQTSPSTPTSSIQRRSAVHCPDSNGTDVAEYGRVSSNTTDVFVDAGRLEEGEGGRSREGK